MSLHEDVYRHESYDGLYDDRYSLDNLKWRLTTGGVTTSDI